MILSVIVPVYNVAPYLETCLDSLLYQKDLDKQYEILCVNDGSTDSSGDILANYAKIHPSIKIITQKNGGLSSARNTGIAAAIGDYIWFVDSDDVVDSHAISQLCRAVDEYNYPDKVLFNYLEFPDGHMEEHCNTYQQCGQFVSFTTGMDMDNSKQVPSWKVAWNYIVKRSILLEHRLTFVEGIFFEDEEFNFWLSRYVRACIYIDSAFYYYRKRAGSILNTFMDTRFRQYIDGRIHLASVHRDMLLRYDAPDSEQLRTVVSRDELAHAVLYDIQGVLSRLLVKGDGDYFESYLGQLKQDGFYPYKVPWKNLIPRKGFSKTLINWVALSFPCEWLLRMYMSVARIVKKGRTHP